MGKAIAQKNITGNRTTGNSVLHATLRSVTDLATIESALQTANAAYYTDARLASMTTNDKVYALRCAVDNANTNVG